MSLDCKILIDTFTSLHLIYLFIFIGFITEGDRKQVFKYLKNNKLVRNVLTVKKMTVVDNKRVNVLTDSMKIILFPSALIYNPFQHKT